MRQDGRSGGRPTHGTLAAGRLPVLIVTVVPAAFPALMARPARYVIPVRQAGPPGRSEPHGVEPVQLVQGINDDGNGTS